MKIFRNVVLFFVFLIIALLALGWIFKDKWIQEVLPEVKNVKVTQVSITNDSAEVEMLLLLQNKNYISYDLKNLELNILNDEFSLLHYTRDSAIVLDRGDGKEIFLRFILPIKKIMKRVKNLQSSDSTEIHISGQAVFSTFFGEYILPINEFIEVKVPNLIKVDLKEVQYGGKKDGKYLLEAKIKITNPNNKRLEIKDIRYDFYGEDLMELHGSYHGVISIQPLSHEWITLPLEVEIKDKFKLLSKIIFNKDVIDYKFTMKGKILSAGGIDQEVPVKVNTHGKVELLKKNKKNKVKFTRDKKHSRKKK